ncbi:MAG TPA: caspase family protein, partial [Gemmataceae bacterium]|nr:caspase family protein [Gemmataceae bacterium]
MLRRLLLAFCLAFAADPASGQPPPAPSESAILDLKIVDGAGAKVFVDNVPRATTRISLPCRPGILGRHVVKVVFPDGRSIERFVHVRGGWNVTLPIVRVSGNRPELVIQTGHADAVTGLARSSNGLYLATAGSGDRRVVLWDLESARELRAYAGYDAWTWCVAFDADDKRLAIGLNDGSVSIRNVADGARLDAVRPDPVGLAEVRAVAFDAAGKHLLIAGKGAKAYLWDLAAKRVRRTFVGHDRPVSAVAFHPKSAKVLIASEDGKARLYDVDTGKLLHTYKGHGGPIRSAVFSADGSTILTSGDDGAAALWDTDRGAVRRLFNAPFNGTKSPLRGAVFTADSNVIVTAARDKSLSAWSIATGERLERFGVSGKPAHTKPIECLVAAADGMTVFSASADCQTIRWDVASRKPVALLRSSVERPYALGFSAGGKKFVTGAGDDLLLMWDPRTAAMVKRLDGPGALIRYIDVSADGRSFLTASDDRTVRLWNGATGKEIGQPFRGHREFVMSARFSPRGDVAVSSARAKVDAKGNVLFNGEAILWSLPSGKRLHVYGGHVGSIWDAALDASGKVLLTCGEDKKAILREVPSGKILHTLEGHTDMVIAGEFTRDGSKVVTASMDSSAILWDVKTGKKIREFAGQHRRGLSTIRFLPDDRELLTVSLDGTICLWDVATAAKLRLFRGHSGPADALALHPDGRHFVTGGGDGTIRLWDLATGEELAWWIAVDPAGKKDRRVLDWVVVTPDGLFDASVGGRDNVSFRLDRQLDVVKIDRFYRDFHRDGLLTTLLSGKRELPPATLGAVQAPVVTIVTRPPNGSVTKEAFTLEAEVSDRGSGIGAVRLRQSGSQFAVVPLKEKRDGVWRYRFDVDLTPGENILEVQADGTEAGSPESEPKRLVVRLEKPAVQGTLHVLAIGIDKCKDPKIAQLRFAHLDADTIAALARVRGKRLFEDIDVSSLPPEQATRKNILAELDAMKSRAKTNDTVVFFFAGHGTLDAETHRFFLVPSDYDETGKMRSACLAESAISGKDLVEKIVEMKALNRLVVLDTCNSGAVQKDLRQVAAESDAMTRNTGVFMLVAALEGQEAKEAKALGHGVLTYTLLAAVGDVE